MMTTALGAGALAVPALAQAPQLAGAEPVRQVRTFNIPAQSLADGLTQFGRQSGWQVAVQSDWIDGIATHGVSGQMAPQQALWRLLAGTGFTYSLSGTNTATLQKLPVSTNSGDSINLPPMQVRGQAGTGYPTDPFAGMVNPPTTVGSKTPLSFRELPQTADVITQQQIQQQNVQTLAQALKYTPGVTVFQSDSERMQYYARGFPISSMQIDGVPVMMNPNMSGTASTNSPNLGMYERVEVLDGPAGLYNGFGNPGGTLNLIRKRGPSQFEASANLGAGTYNNFLGTLDVGGPLNRSGTIRGRFVATGQTHDLNQKGIWQHDQSYYGTIEADMAPATTVRAGASYMQRDSNLGWAWKTPVYTDGTPVSGPSKFYGAPWSHDRYETVDVFLGLDHKFGHGWKLSINGDYTYNSGHIYSASVLSAVSPATNTATFGTTDKDMVENNESFDVNLSGPYSLFSRSSEAVLGVNYEHMNNLTSTYWSSGTTAAAWLNQKTLNVFDYVFAQPVFPRTPSTTTTGTTTTNNYGIYASTRIKILDPLALIVGARVTWYDYAYIPDKAYNAAKGAATSGDYTGKFTPYAGLIYDINSNYSIYISYASIFQPQTYQQRSGIYVPPIEGNQYEIGIKASYWAGRFNASAALFQIDQENRATLDPSDPTNTYYIATGKARTRGVDLRLSGQLMPDWTVFAGYTFSDSKYLDTTSIDSSASSFTQIAPKHLFKLWTNYRLPGPLSKWDIGGGVNVVGTLYYNAIPPKVVQPTYITADARIGYKMNDRVNLTVNVTNLFNKIYYQPEYIGAAYGEGRRVMFNLHLKY